MSVETMKLALEALEADEQDMVADKDGHMVFRVNVAIKALRQAIEQAGRELIEKDAGIHISQQKQEPVAWINWSALTGKRRLGWECESELASEPLYTSPPPRQPLSDEQISVIVRETSKGPDIRRDGAAFQRVARAIEAAHGIKE